MKRRYISDKLWDRMEPLLPSLTRKPGKVGRPPVAYREIMEAIFWILRTGAQWSELPKGYPAKSTVHDRFQYLVEHQFFELLAKELAEELESSGVIDLEECFIDGTFATAKKGVLR